ncbi:hypothetical protein Hanom_Chr03g00188591 [Helianthus anomalus]
MGFGPAQVSARDVLRHETGLGLERAQFDLSFGLGRISARGRFWIKTRSARLEPTWVSCHTPKIPHVDFTTRRVTYQDLASNHIELTVE